MVKQESDADAGLPSVLWLTSQSTPGHGCGNQEFYAAGGVLRMLSCFDSRGRSTPATGIGRDRRREVAMERGRGTVLCAFHPHHGSVESRRGEPGSSGSRGAWWGLSGPPLHNSYLRARAPLPKRSAPHCCMQWEIGGEMHRPWPEERTFSSHQLRRSIDERDPPLVYTVEVSCWIQILLKRIVPGHIYYITMSYPPSFPSLGIAVAPAHRNLDAPQNSTGDEQINNKRASAGALS
ncbi:hypothetical protein B0J18DRAFT_142606 [Chaetomium sp. MPI-SDFR-AT-0129]|nr:hypothetical protein B0J18DRAFT_142606 [Chaetomium sp. MPI-SDFR-AT-0129]